MKVFPEKKFIEIISISFMRTLNAEAMNESMNSVIYALSMVAIATISIFFVSILIGLLTGGIQSKIWSLRKGRSMVIEKNHTIILGWSEMVYTIISELIEANSNQKKSCIVIMGNKDKVEMEDSIREKVPVSKNTRIICRQGNPIDVNDLIIVNLNTSKSIIIIGDLDSNVIKTILAIISNKLDRKEPFHIVAMIKELENLEVAKIAGMNQVEFILAKDFIPKIIAQTSRQPGLSIVYNELLDFKGDEIYIAHIKELAGKTFKEILFLFEDSSVIGITYDSVAKLNPPMDTIINENNNIIAISEDDDTILLSGLTEYNINKSVIIRNKLIDKKIERTLILGWNDQIESIIREIDNYVIKGSLITVAANLNGKEIDLKNKYSHFLNNLEIEFISTNITDRNELSVLVSKIYNHIIILSRREIDIQEADAETLITLLHLRDIVEKEKLNFSITTEMLDINNRKLAKIAKVNDFIVSDKMISFLLTQIAENKILNSVFEDILNAEGSEIYIKKVRNYVEIDKSVNFYTLVESASLKNEIVIGYKILEEEDFEEKNYGIYINPNKSDYISFKDNDSIIVIAED
jgi:voltage-gated potassium channel Kch